MLHTNRNCFFLLIHSNSHNIWYPILELVAREASWPHRQGMSLISRGVGRHWKDHSIYHQTHPAYWNRSEFQSTVDISIDDRTVLWYVESNYRHSKVYESELYSWKKFNADTHNCWNCWTHARLDYDGSYLFDLQTAFTVENIDEAISLGFWNKIWQI
jgi:hypothetical protein